MMADASVSQQCDHQRQEEGVIDVNDIELGKTIDLDDIECKLGICFGPKHMRKGFEVECIRGERGPKFGSYGTFLPTHERRPACNVGRVEAVATYQPVRSCKTKKRPMTGYVNEKHEKKGKGHTKEPRKEIEHKDGFDVRKMNKSSKELNKLGLSEASACKEMNVLNYERNGVPKEIVLGWVATHEKVVVNTEHVKDTGLENNKTHDINISKEALKEENKEVTKDEFKESVKETLLGNMRHKEPAKTDSKSFHASDADLNIEQVGIKKETGMVHCIEDTKQAGHKHFDRQLSRVIESQKKKDIAGEYILEKLENVSNAKAFVSKEVDTRSLPEHQKYGRKFKGYGSLLQMNEQSPTRHPQLKTPVHVPVLVPTYNSQRAANEGAVEEAPTSVMTAMPLKIDSSAPRNPSVQETAVYEYTKETCAANGAELNEIHLMKRMAVLSDGTDGKQKEAILSRKLDFETVSDAKKTAIYSALGLESSPSASLGYSPDKSQMDSTEVASPLDSNPLSFIEVMTSHHVPGVSFLSPPQCILFNLTEKGDFSACLSKDGNMETEAAQHPGKPCKTEKVSMTGYVNEIHKKQGQLTKDPRNDISYKDVSDVRKINKSIEDVNKFSLSEVSACKERNVLNAERNRVPKDKVLGRMVTSKKAVMNMELVNKIELESKKTCDINISKKTLKEKCKEDTKYNYKESVEETLLGNEFHREPVKTESKGFHTSSANLKIEQVDIKKDTSMAHFIESTKQARHRRIDRKFSRMIEREKKRDIVNEYDSKTLEHVSNIKSQLSKEVDTWALPEQTATQYPAMLLDGPFLISYNWVHCDACGKWRLLPNGVECSSLPEKWFCHMLYWLPQMNHCDVPEEETKKGVLNMSAFSQSQEQIDTNQHKDQLPSTISKALPDTKISHHIQKPRSLQSSTKFGNDNKRGLVQRSMPNVSGTVKVSSSFAGRDEQCPAKIKSEPYERHMEQMEGIIGFSHFGDEGKSNRVTK